MRRRRILGRPGGWGGEDCLSYRGGLERPRGPEGKDTDGIKPVGLGLGECGVDQGGVFDLGLEHLPAVPAGRCERFPAIGIDEERPIDADEGRDDA